MFGRSTSLEFVSQGGYRPTAMKTYSSILLLLTALTTSLITSCATYQAGFRGRGMSGGYTLVAVPVFKNMTPETGTEVEFTNAMIRELSRSKVAKVTDKEASQATLEGVVEKISYAHESQIKHDPTADPLSAQRTLPSNTVLTTTYRVYVTTKLTLRRNSDQAVLWSNNFQSERVYAAPIVTSDVINSANATYNHSARYQTIAEIAKDLMAEAHDRLVENYW